MTVVSTCHTHLTSNASASKPAAIGADADVPV